MPGCSGFHEVAWLALPGQLSPGSLAKAAPHDLAGSSHLHCGKGKPLFSEGEHLLPAHTCLTGWLESIS